MKFINKIIKKHKDMVRERNQICDDYISQIDKALQDKDAIFAKQSSFIELAVYFLLAGILLMLKC